MDDDSIVDALGNALGGTGAGNGNFTGEVYAVTTPPLASYLFEEASWNGSADQVADSQGGNPGTARNGATTASQSPALGGSPGTCRYGVFTSPSTPTVSNGYVDLKASFPYQTDSFTLAAWVRTTSNSTADQWIFKHNTTGTGYALSLGTAGAGRLRFTSGGSATPNLDSPATAGSLLANDTWYFVAAVADFSSAPNIVRRLYVYNAAGSLLSGYPVTVTATGWGSTESGAATLGGDGSSSVRGFVDDVRLFGKVLDAAALTGLAQERHTCTTVAPDHYEIAMDTSSIACMPTPVTVTACADSSSPCTSPFTSASGRTVTLATSAGALGTTVLTLDAAGTASTTLAHGGAADGTSVTVTLSSVETIANNATRCCADGTSCSAASSCSTTFSTAGFIFAASAGGAAATVPAQTAGTTSGNFVLRAVKTSTTTAACVSALSGANTVDWAYECNDPSTCSGSNLMSVNGGSSTTVARNNNGSVGSYTSVPMSFDANGNANFNFTFNDVGRATLRVRKTVNSALLQGASDAFVSKPAGFTVTGIAQTAAPNTANPGATGPTGGVFVKAGEAFRATVTATTSTGAAAPNFGKESSPEGVSLTRALVLPAGGSSGALSNGTVAGGNFTNGVATVTNLAFSEVGVIRLSPAVADGNYLGAGTATGTTTGNIGRFVPARFALSSAALTHRAAQACAPASAYTYLDENFSLTMTLTAQNTAGATTSNYTGSFARFDATAVGSWGLKGIAGTTVFISEPSGRLSLGSASGSWANGVLAGATLSATGLRSSAPDGPFDVAFGVAPSDADGTVLASYDLDTDQPANGNDRLTVATVALRFGRLRLHNAIGAADRSLALPLRAESWNGSAFALNTLDSCSRVPTTAVNLGRRRGSLIASDVAPAGNVTLANGAGRLVLTAPGGGRSGTLDAALSLGSAADTACGGTWAPSPAATAGAGLAALRSNWCSTAYSHDPTARATFGRQRGNSNTVYRRESF